MPLTMVLRRDVEARYRDFLTSVMLEIATDVHVAPEMSKAVRGRVWTVLSGWREVLQRGEVVTVWRDAKAPGRLRVETLGDPPKEIVDADGVLLAKWE